ncbi:BAG domain-containing protein Samui-like [Stegodyphus dumicola]|uniref:BAG domain-containing protein Samui-like n=1 Tax=Stegodyphus dumicola TaxID=202533 RepID=UPI0015AD6566|nr:BAG domain-containing protein Samui-like [Stegodyphus dumicola]
MTWSPSGRHFRSPGSSPETYRRIIHTEDDFPPRKTDNEEEFFSGRRSPTFPRRIFKEVWNESPNHRFPDRPRMFKRVFKPGRWDSEFDGDIPNIRRVERQFDHDFEDGRPSSRKFDEEFDKRFSARDLQKDLEEEFEKAEGRVHHIPIMVERRMEEMKSRFEKPSSPEDLGVNSRYNHHRVPTSGRPRAFTNPTQDSWDPHAIHTLPTRRIHKSSQSFDDSRHPVPPKSVFRSYSETHEDIPRQQQQHSAAFRSHSDGHCPKQTYVTKIEVKLPSQKEREELCSTNIQTKGDSYDDQVKPQRQNIPKHQECEGNENRNTSQTSETYEERKPRKNKFDSPSLQQIAVILQNVEDLVVRVEAYNGTGRDKQFRFLDEMLTRCMLRLDDIDTEGREDIRSARKAAVREVQSCIDKLEAKADESERRQKEKDSESKSSGNSVDQSDENQNKMEDKKSSEELKNDQKEETDKVDDNEQTKL